MKTKEVEIEIQKIKDKLNELVYCINTLNENMKLIKGLSGVRSLKNEY